MTRDGPCGGEDNPHVSCLGAGLWAGFIFAISGSFGLAACKRPSLGMITASVVLNIVAFLFAVPLIVISGFGMTEHSYPLNQAVRITYGLEMLAGVAECIVAMTTAYYLTTYCRRGTGISDQYHDNLDFDITSPKFTI